MSKETRQELADFLRFCESERRLAPTTCAAYERDVSACLSYLQAEGLVGLDWHDVDLSRRLLRVRKAKGGRLGRSRSTPRSRRSSPSSTRPVCR
jgi:site-specific recombinase XerD